MSLKENLSEEQQLQQRIFTAIDNFDSFIIQAGAGAGKTYTLIESIKYILHYKIDELDKHNQKIMCITYTNVAANEIRQRLGETQYVQVSTIHEMLWQQIKMYRRSELTVLHLKKLKQELENIESEIKTQTDCVNLSTLKTKENLELFSTFIEEKKEEFFTLDRNKIKADKFRNQMMQSDLVERIPEFKEKIIKNVNTFKNFFKLVSRQISFKKAIDKLESKNNDKKIQIDYDSLSNSDRLPAMKFSHDTLLEYSLALAEKYKLFQKKLIDQYPYIFIDEYQDTHESVIKLMAGLQQYSKGQRWLVGYFGDSQQNIYDSGIGNQILNIYQNIPDNGLGQVKLQEIVKPFNRRSEQQIIELVNKIRNDKLHQKSLDPDKTNGEVNFYYLDTEGYSRDTSTDNLIIKQFIEKFAQCLGDNEKIDCLLLLNRYVASMSGFEQIYSAIQKANFILWDEINTKLFARELDKLHPAVLRLYQLVTAYNNCINPHKTLYDLFGDTQSEVTFAVALKLAQLFRCKHPNNLHEFIQHIDNVLNDLCVDQNNVVLSEQEAVRFWLKKNFGFNFQYLFNRNKNKTQNIGFKDYMYGLVYEEMYGKIEKFNPDVELTDEQADEEINKRHQDIDEILNIDLNIWQQWVAFINNEHNKEQTVTYHTYHGTKGEEYDNVAIIMEHNFGKTNKNKFKNYFASLSLEPEQTYTEEETRKLENSRNLFYTACSRARKKLWILYLDDIKDIEDNLKKLFTSIKPFKYQG